MSNLKKVLSETVLQTEDEYIFVEPVCKFFGINYRNQLERISRDKICQKDMRKNSSFSIFGNNFQRVCLGKRGFIRWIQIINAEIVRSELRELFQKYQVAVFDYLYQGVEARQTQLEDIRNYAININNAIIIRNHVMEYVGEQKRHRDLCLATPPEQWLKVRENLIQTKAIPGDVEKMKSINPLPADKNELRRLKKNLRINIIKNRNMLKYQTPTIQLEDNPLPEGYHREKLKLLIKNKQEQIARINERMLELEKTEG